MVCEIIQMAMIYSTNVKAAEHSTEQLKAEDERLQALRAEIMIEQANLEARKEEVVLEMR